MDSIWNGAAVLILSVFLYFLITGAYYYTHQNEKPPDWWPSWLATSIRKSQMVYSFTQDTVMYSKNSTLLKINLWAANAYTRTECANVCSINSNCVGFYYNSSFQTPCNIYDDIAFGIRTNDRSNLHETYDGFYIKSGFEPQRIYDIITSSDAVGSHVGRYSITNPREFNICFNDCTGTCQAIVIDYSSNVCNHVSSNTVTTATSEITTYMANTVGQTYTTNIFSYGDFS